jgi:serine/threonine-protein kinase RsbT
VFTQVKIERKVIEPLVGGIVNGVASGVAAGITEGCVWKLRVAIHRDTDIVLACHKGRMLAERLGLSGNDQAVVVIAISEMAHNILKYAGSGKIVLGAVQQNDKPGICVVALDEGPGIADVEWAMRDGSSTSGSLGLGLSGTKRLVDEFGIVSELGSGTIIAIRKWKSERE